MADELKSDYLLKILIFQLLVNKMIILIISTIKSILTLGYSIIFKGKKYYSDILTLRSGYFEKNNIKEWKAKPLLKKLILNINIISTDLPPKQCRLPR